MLEKLTQSGAIEHTIDRIRLKWAIDQELERQAARRAFQHFLDDLKFLADIHIGV